MNKGIFKASFEESRRIVTDKYIEHVLGLTSKKMINRRMWMSVVFVILILIISGFLYLVDFSDSQSESIITFKLSSLNIVWICWSIASSAYYLYRNRQSRKRRMLNDYYTDQFHVLILATIAAQLYPLFLFGTAYITGMPNMYIVSIVFSTIIFVQLALSSVKVMKGRLYTEKYKTDRFLDLAKTSTDFLAKFGGIILVLITIYRLFTVDQVSLLDTIELYLVVAAPLLVPLGVGFTFKWIFQATLLPGYYLKTYYEEYRVEFGFTEEEWNIGYGTDED